MEQWLFAGVGYNRAIWHYCQLQAPKYIEIGSGNSTKVARKAIVENNLKTEITSIDPFPRANIDHLADSVIRKPFESLSDNKFIIESLEENDILFIDNSHRVFPNSDSMICFLELIPFLKKGLLYRFMIFIYPMIILNLCVIDFITNSICLPLFTGKSGEI